MAADPPEITAGIGAGLKELILIDATLINPT